MSDTPTVLFVCASNAGRSQMAAALLEQLGGTGVRVLSAGTDPADHLHPNVVEAMREVGVDLSSRRPRRLDDQEVRQADVVVTMGCGDECPVYPGKRYEDWDLTDPAEKPIEDVRAIRDDIERRVRGLLHSLVAQGAPVPELPDVEHYRRVFAEHAAGRRVERVVTSDASILRGVDAGSLDRALRGQRFEEPERHGKWLIAWTSGPAVLIHFGMTGDLIPAGGPDGRHRHDRVIFELDRGELRYRNMRKLGGLWLAHDRREAGRLLGSLGPDALGLGRRGFRTLLSRRRGGVKAALMDQTFLAGVGNLLADEILWQARIHPATRIEDLPPEQRERLFDALRKVVRTSVERFDDVPHLRGWLNPVRGEPGAACPRCGTPLARAVVAGRTTWFCPRCQAPPPLH